MLKRLAMLIGVIFTGGCSSLDVLNALSVAPHAPPITIAYGESARHRVDLYPGNATGQGRPVVVFFYGGAWATGSRKDYGFLARTFNDMGYIVAIPDYRLTPETVYPGFLHDSADAVRALLDRVQEYGGDPNRIVLVGHSAGAYNAIMLAVDPRWLGEQNRKRIRGVIGLSSPVNFLPIQMPEARAAFSWPNTPLESQPVVHVSAQSPPMLLLTARRDPLVDPVINSVTMAERLRAAGVYVSFEVFEGPLGLINHSNIVATFSSRLSFLAPSIQRAREFVERVAR
ncbi:MAG: alpha/beta hydrolase [Burkholderiaceae bacterium]|nr:alpha/beta hydrolase [Burkholderiaceae bacterium]